MLKKFNNYGVLENQLISESKYKSRRLILKSLGFGTLALANIKLSRNLLANNHYPTNPNFLEKSLGTKLTSKENATTYNNFYEFGSSKNIHKRAQDLILKPWLIEIDGEVGKKQTIDFSQLISKFDIEERYYRFRCVEAWSMAVPWLGFPLRKLISYIEPLSSAKYISFQTASQPKTMPGLKQYWYPWPYLEALTMAEAMNDLTFMATGIFGEQMPKQNGAPIRLVTPWKYGFKSIKSINKITFTKERPVNFWQKINAKEYGFFANVNPEVPHPRWTQATERDLDSGDRKPSIIYNGYGDYVASLYQNMNEEVFR